MPMNDEHRHEIQPIPETELQRIVRDELERALDEIRRAFSGAGVQSVQPVGLDVSMATAAPECKHCWHTLSTQHDFWRPEFDHQSAVAETTRTKSLCCRCGMVTSSSLYSARLDDRVHQTRFLVDGSSGAEDGD